MTFGFKALFALMLLGCLAFLAILSLRRIAGRERTRRVVSAFSAVFVSSLIALACAEFATRLIFSDVTTTGDNSSYFARRWKRSHPPRVNAEGFRERDFDREPKPGIYRIAVIGDSFAYGQGILETQRFSNLIEDDLNAGGVGYEVLNFGIPGAETVDHIKILEESVVPANVDFVLLQWFINDVENDDHGNRPKYRRLIPSDTLSSFLHDHSALYYLANFQWQQMQVTASGSESYEEYMQNRFGDPSSDASRAADEALNAFFEICRGEDLPVGVVLFPQLLENLDSDYPFAFLHDRVITICEQRQIECLDLRPFYATHKPARGLWANRLDSHPGPQANRIAAEQIRLLYGARWESGRAAKLARKQF